MVSRITQNNMSNNYLRNLNKSLVKQTQLNTDLSTGKSLHKPSDDPVKTIRSMTFASSLSHNEQYTQNLKDAQSWMQTTDGAMSDIGEMWTSVKELVVRASTGSNPQSSMEATGQEIDNIINQLVSIGNTKIGDRYVFAGQKDKTSPFIRDEVTGAITYNGDSGKISMVIQNDRGANPIQDSVNLTGMDMFGEDGVKTLNQLNEIKNKLMEGSKEAQDWLQTEGLQIIDDAKELALQSQTALGTRMSVYEMNLNMLEDNNVIINQDLSSNEDVDIPVAIMNMKVAESVYNAALSVGSKILPPSLADYLN